MATPSAPKVMAVVEACAHPVPWRVSTRIALLVVTTHTEPSGASAKPLGAPPSATASPAGLKEASEYARNVSSSPQLTSMSPATASAMTALVWALPASACPLASPSVNLVIIAS
jgi:hypothetical protein